MERSRWPTADGSANQVLKTDGSGSLSWSSAATSVNGLSDALVEDTGSMYVGNDPSSSTDAADYNVAVGTTALDAVTTGDSNTALGYNALTANLAGNRNTAVGTNALKSNTSGITNVALGSSALESNTTANSNTAVGHASSFKLNSGQNNVTLGYEASKNMTNANDNVIIGSGANPSADTGTANQIVLGKDATGQADNSVTLGNADVTAFIWHRIKERWYMQQVLIYRFNWFNLENDETITNSTDGTVLINGTVSGGTGSAAGVFTSNGDQDVTLQTGNSTTGSITITDGANGNIAITPNGSGAVQLDGLSWPTADGSANQVLATDGSAALSWSSVATDLDGLSDAKSGGSNFSNSMILGHQTTGTLDNADENVAVGIASLESITSGDRNTAVGKGAMNNNTSGSYNASLGYQSLYTNNTGDFNTAVGNSSLGLNEGGSSNTGLGHRALNSNTTGNLNIAVGRRALYSTTTSRGNAAIGSYALEDANRTADTDGYNVGLGYNAGNTGTNDITTGNKNTLLGASTAASSSSRNKSDCNWLWCIR